LNPSNVAVAQETANLFGSTVWLSFIQNICNQSAMSLQNLVVLNSMAVYDKVRKLPNVNERLQNAAKCKKNKLLKNRTRIWFSSNWTYWL